VPAIKEDMYINTHCNYSQPASIKLDNENIGGHCYTFTPTQLHKSYCTDCDAYSLALWEWQNKCGLSPVVTAPFSSGQKTWDMPLTFTNEWMSLETDCGQLPLTRQPKLIFLRQQQLTLVHFWMSVHVHCLEPDLTTACCILQSVRDLALQSVHFMIAAADSLSYVALQSYNLHQQRHNVELPNKTYHLTDNNNNNNF